MVYIIKFILIALKIRLHSLSVQLHQDNGAVYSFQMIHCQEIFSGNIDRPPFWIELTLRPLSSAIMCLS